MYIYPIHIIKTEYLSHKSEIANTFSKIRKFSYKEKRIPILDEEKINSFLDAILDFKSDLKEKTDKTYEVNERLEKVM